MNGIYAVISSETAQKNKEREPNLTIFLPERTDGERAARIGNKGAGKG